MRTVHASPIALALAILASSMAAASCQPGKMTYADIDAIRFTRQGCGGLKRGPAVLRCSTYWLFFATWNGYAMYDQYRKDVSPGDYRLAGTMDDARNILERHNFFNLVPRRTDLTDIAESDVTVSRCKITTRMAAFPIAGEDPQILALFDDFEKFVSSAKRTRIGNAPLLRFPYLSFGSWPSAE
jgi:hypothetical protein